MADLLPAGLNAGGAASFQALQVVDALAQNEDGAKAVVSAGVLGHVKTWPKMPVAPSDKHMETFLMDCAAWTLSNLLDRQPAASAAEVKAQAAEACLSRVISLLNDLPFTCSSWSGDENLKRVLEKLKESELGLGNAREALKVVVEGGSCRLEQANLLTKCNMLTRYQDIVANDPDMGKKIIQGLRNANDANDNEGRLVIIDLISSLPRDKLTALARNDTSGLVQPILQVLDTDCDAPPEVKICAAECVTTITGLPGVSNMTLDAIPLILAQLEVTPYYHTLSESYVDCICTLLRDAEKSGKENSIQMAEKLVRHKALAIFQERLSSDLEATQTVTQYCCNAIGLLACTEDGKTAVCENVSKGSVNMIVHLLKEPKARAAALKPLSDRLQPFLGYSVSRRKRVSTLQLIVKLCNNDGSKAVIPLIPILVGKIKDARTPERVLDILTAWTALCISLAGGLGPQGIEELKKADAFATLLQLSMAGSNAGRDWFVDWLKDVLHSALLDSSFTSEAQSVIDQVLDLLPSEIDHMKPTTARASLKILQKLMPINDNSPAVVKTRDLVGPKLIPKLCSILKSADQWSRLRRLNGLAIDVLSSTFESHEKNLQQGTELGVLDFALDFIEDAAGLQKVESYAALIQDWPFGREHRFRDAILNAGILRKVEPILRAGPASPGFSLCVCVLCFIATNGNKSHRKSVLSSEAASIMCKWLLEGWAFNFGNFVGRVYAGIVSIGAKSHPQAHELMRKTIEEMGEGDPGTVSDAVRKLLSIVRPLSEGAERAMESQVVPMLLTILEDKTLEKAHGDAMDCLFHLALMHRISGQSGNTAQEMRQAARVCAKKVRSKLEDGVEDATAAKVLSVLAEISPKANAAIRMTIPRISEEDDQPDEAFARCVVQTLRAMCEMPGGAAVAVQAGIVQQGMQVLASARGRVLREQTLELLDLIAANNYSGCLAMRDVIETALSLITTSLRVKKSEMCCTSSVPSSLPNAAVEEKEGGDEGTFEFDCFLSHDWGTDELGRNNHERVERLNQKLKDCGIRTWFDGDKMQGSINNKMAEGISASRAVIAFITSNYIKKASGKGPRGEDDNCFFEFDGALLERGRQKIIPVVMEPQCRQVSSWEPGTVKLKLGSKLYVSLVADDDDDEYEDGFNRLLQEIETVTGRKRTVNAHVQHNSSFNKQLETLNGQTKECRDGNEETDETNDGLGVGNAALALMATLSQAEPLRAAIESVNPLDAMEYICLKYPGYRCTALRILANVYSTSVAMDLTSPDRPGHNHPHDQKARVIKDKVINLFDKFEIEEAVVRDLDDSLHYLRHQNNTRFLERDLSVALSLATIPYQRKKLVKAGLGAKLVQVFTEATQHPVGANDAHLALACDIVFRLSLSSELRPALKEGKLEKVLTGAFNKVEREPEEQRTENMVRLLQSSDQALQALNGRLDKSLTNPKLQQKHGALKSLQWTDQALLALPTFQTFISHKRSSAQDFARTLHSMIVSQNISCFLDVENLDKIDNLSVIVAGCDAFIFVLSDGLLESPFCCRELAAAVHAGVPVVVVTKEGARFPDKYKNNTEAFPSYDLLEESFSGPFLQPCRNVFKSKAIQHSNEYFGAFSVALLKRINQCIAENAKSCPDRSTRVPLQRRKVLEVLAAEPKPDVPLRHTKAAQPSPESIDSSGPLPVIQRPATTLREVGEVTELFSLQSKALTHQAETFGRLLAEGAGNCTNCERLTQLLEAERTAKCTGCENLMHVLDLQGKPQLSTNQASKGDEAPRTILQYQMQREMGSLNAQKPSSVCTVS